jgi:hypothetical protein
MYNVYEEFPIHTLPDAGPFNAKKCLLVHDKAIKSLQLRIDVQAELLANHERTIGRYELMMNNYELAVKRLEDALDKVLSKDRTPTRSRKRLVAENDDAKFQG